MSYKLVEFFCEACGETGEHLERRDALPDEKPCSCGGTSKRCLSAVKQRQVWGTAAVTGKSDPRPPYALNTESMGDGQSWRQWKNGRRKMRRDIRYANLKRALS